MEKTERNKKIYQDVMNGQSKISVAVKYGLSKTRVEAILRDIVNGKTERKTVYKSVNKVIYPNIRAWMIENDISLKRFREMIGDYKVAMDTFRRFVFGESGGSIELIKEVLRVTGMTFEEAFRK